MMRNKNAAFLFLYWSLKAGMQHFSFPTKKLNKEWRILTYFLKKCSRNDAFFFLYKRKQSRMLHSCFAEEKFIPELSILIKL